MSELLHIRAGDSDFSVTVGRSTAGFVYGTRSLPDDIDGIPAFIMDSTPLLVNQMNGTVEKDSSQVFTYGGADGRDLISRSEMIPKGQFSFTRSDLSVTRHEEDHEDGTTTRTTTKDFDVAGTIRRVTGDVHVSVELGQDSLGTIIPGVDIHVGDHVMLEVWGQTLELVVSSYRHSSTGWKITVESVVQAPTLSKTNEMVQKWRTPSERIEQLSKEVRDIKDYQENMPLNGDVEASEPTPGDGDDSTTPVTEQQPPQAFTTYGGFNSFTNESKIFKHVNTVENDDSIQWEFDIYEHPNYLAGTIDVRVALFAGWGSISEQLYHHSATLKFTTFGGGRLADAPNNSTWNKSGEVFWRHIGGSGRSRLVFGVMKSASDIHYLSSLRNLGLSTLAVVFTPIRPGYMF